MRRHIRLLLPVLAVTAAAIAGACSSPQTELKQWDSIQALEASVNELKAYTSDLETLVDSLNKIVLRQDTALRLIVDFTGAQVPAYKPPGAE